MTKKSEIILHIIFWILSFWVLLETFSHVELYEEYVNGTQTSKVVKYYKTIPTIFTILVKIGIVYFNVFVLFPKYLEDKRLWQYVIKAVLLILVGMAIESGLNYTYLLVNSDRGRFPFFTSPILNFFLTLLLFGLSLSYAFALQNVNNERIRHQLAQEKLNAELKFLKSQINPHFLFNTLNNLYAISGKNNYTEISSGIHELSNLMRYMLYEAKADKVPLQKEISYLKSVIEIQQYRVSDEDDIFIAFNVKGEYHDKKIAPLILVPFVENAFKHGIDYTKSSFIKIDLKVVEDQLFFTLSNSNHRTNVSEITESSGIGLANVRRRLELIYQDRYDLKIENNEDIFKVELTLPVE